MRRRLRPAFSGTLGARAQVDAARRRRAALDQCASRCFRHSRSRSYHTGCLRRSAVVRSRHSRPHACAPRVRSARRGLALAHRRQGLARRMGQRREGCRCQRLDSEQRPARQGAARIRRMSEPLAGLRVIELGTLIAGPFCARILAEFGAEVIKIEAPDGGDPLRSWRKLHRGTSLWWSVQARNKKSVTANLRVAAGQEVVRRLVERADIVVENFRPGALEKWNLGWEKLSALNPKLIMVRLSGYGQTGPYRDRPGFGAIGEAMGGIRFISGDPDRPPVRAGISLGDSVAAMYGVIGALTALHARQHNGGRGQMIDVALYEAVFSLMESMLPEYDVTGFIRTRTGASLPGIVPSNTYTTRDGKYLVIGANADSIFKRFMMAIGRDDLAHDPTHANNE